MFKKKDLNAIGANTPISFAKDCVSGTNGRLLVSGFCNVSNKQYNAEPIPFCIEGYIGKPQLTPWLLQHLWNEAAEIGLKVHECLELIENPFHAPKIDNQQISSNRNNVEE